MLIEFSWKRVAVRVLVAMTIFFILRYFFGREQPWVIADK
jgi:hypothetical protein